MKTMHGYRHDFTEAELAVCTAFADRRAQRDRKHYEQRNSKGSKIRVDMINGGLGEIAAHCAMLRAFGEVADIPPPDFALHTVQQKSWDPDLYATFHGCAEPVRAQVKMHVCHRYNNTVPKSFMFQRAGSGRHEDKHLRTLRPGGDSQDWLVGVLGYVTDPAKLTANGSVRSDAVADFAVVCGPYPLQSVVDQNLWRPPSHRRLREARSKKRCLWLSDLEAKVPRITGVLQDDHQ
jgi:hypothetical protein